MIARELLVKLGFDIDSSKLDKFNASIDATKNKMQAIRNSSLQGVSSIGGSKLANAVSQQTGKYQFASALTKEELLPEKELIRLNKIENQAIKETTKVEKAELKERQRLTREHFKENQILQRSEERGFKTSMVSMSRVARKFAIVGASITAGFGLSLRSTLKDVANFKEGKSSSSFDKSQIAAVDAFNKALDSTKSTAASLRNSFVIDMLPAIKETLEVFNSWVQKNKVLIQEKLKDIVVGLAGAFKVLSSVIKQIVTVFDFLIEKTVGWKVVISSIIVLGASAWFISLASSVLAAARAFKVLVATTLIGSFISAITTIRTIGMAAWFGGLIAPILAAANAFKVFALAILTNPLTLVITAVIAALVLLVDEIYTTIQGGDSFINDFLKSDAWTVCKNYIDHVVQSLRDMWQWLLKIKDGILDFPSNITTEIKGLIDIGKNKFNDVFNNDSGKLGQGNLKHLALPKYEPELLSNSSITNNARSANVTQKTSFNMTINVPVGTTQEQAKEFAKIAQSQIEKHQAFQTEKTLAAIGSY